MYIYKVSSGEKKHLFFSLLVYIHLLFYAYTYIYMYNIKQPTKKMCSSQDLITINMITLQ